MPTISFTYNINVNSLVDSIFSSIGNVLPESVVKTLKIKEVLKNDPSLSIFEAVKQFDLSYNINVNSLVDSIFSSIGNIVSLYL
jgi:ACT domain-containing protein